MINHRITNLRDQSDLNTPILGAYEHGSTRWVLLSPSSAGRVPDFHYLFQSDCGSSYRFEWRGYWHVWSRKPECDNIGNPFRAGQDRKSTPLNSSHEANSCAVL